MIQHSRIVLFLLSMLTLCNCGSPKNEDKKVPQELETNAENEVITDENPDDIEIKQFAGPDMVPSPACLAVAPSGEVFVGVDMMGSLGKDPDKGSIVKLVDSDNDGIADKQTIYANVDNPRGIYPLGDQLFVLHTTFSKETGIATGMDLVVFEDLDGDGIADSQSKPIIKNICSPKFIISRGTDHATNGIRMGIDGWIYIAVGDFGFHDAIDRSGKKMTMLGGGIVRVRPDGTEMEIYTHGMRNIYDVAIDPYMNIFTRGNTNDGGGWNVRFVDHIQSGEYGYPVLFKHFTDEILPALVDVGGGSGTGSLFMDDANWPEKYNQVPMMADWGRSQLYIHRTTPDGASFTQKEESFIKLSQITDLDVDASGRLYMSAWDGAGYRGDPNKGFVVRAVPKGWKYKSFPDLKKLSVKKLAKMLKSGSASARLHAQQELIKRPAKGAAKAAWGMASDKKLPLDTRIAGMYAYTQITGENGIDNLVKLTSEAAIKEFALRALSDRKKFLDKVPIAPFIEGLKDPSERVQAAAIIGLGRLGRIEAAEALLQIPVPSSVIHPVRGTEGPHATPNSEIIPAHLAVRSLVGLHAVEACISAVEKDQSLLGLWALKYMYSPGTVNGLIKAYASAKKPTFKNQILSTISRLYKKEGPYDGSWWWSTRPDTHGPYYKAITWEESPAIKDFLTEVWKKTDTVGKKFFADLNGKHRMGITEFGGEEVTETKKDASVDLEKIKNKKGQIGATSIEDVMIALSKLNGDPKLGKKIFTKQGCIACHSVEKGEALKGPFMGQIGSIMSKDQIAESILKPNASISQGFASVLIAAKGDKNYTGFITEETADKVVMRNIAGQVFTIKTADIVSRTEMETSMMPAGLANALSFDEFASLIQYLSQQKK